MSVNKEWHQSHRMPSNPSLDQRMAWHQEHVQNCSCAPIPEKLKQEIKNQKTKESK
ncbi:MAG: hypothetical protein J4215_00190 [Candidatus Diapherotrites archaeon]|uniref:Uncharacterized protein n=1 Tax=Candidatus Iainarchaeum sp. TaxID=3101447 RepID=A0A8T4L528_9ARCH|nr:hypothetical protein [Candidatus Diapherotrites archaeon]